MCLKWTGTGIGTFVGGDLHVRGDASPQARMYLPTGGIAAMGLEIIDLNAPLLAVSEGPRYNCKFKRFAAAADWPSQVQP